MSSEQEGPPPGTGGGPLWINTAMQSQMEWRDDDIVVSVPAKSGTTWTMNIVHQLRVKGDPNFEDIYAEVKWIEAMDTPDSTVDDMVRKLNAMEVTKPRTFKTHSSPPSLPRHENNKYVVVARNPEEVVISMRIFAAKHSPKFLKHWGSPPMNFPDVQSFYDVFIKGMGFDKQLYEFMNGWWKLRDKDNVLLIHYSDMVKDHEGSIRRISDFVGAGPYTDEEWKNIIQFTSFQWMKEHEEKFEAKTIWDPPVLMRGGMMRQGSSGLARKEGLTEEMANDLRARAKETLKDTAAFEWFYEGGDL